MKYFLTTTLLFFSSFLFSQILTVNSSSSVSIASGSSISLGGLEIAPNDTYVINGANAVSRTATAVTAGDNSSVSHVYTTTALLTNFTGTLTFSYLDGELNNITESDLVLELQAGDDSWTSYNGTVTNNTISFTFDTPVSFKAVTASASGATLTIEDINPAGSSILVYPNPTADRIYIQADTNSKAELYDLLGRKVRSTNQSQIDMSTLSRGNYILQVKTQNKTQSFKIIKQ